MPEQTYLVVIVPAKPKLPPGTQMQTAGSFWMPACPQLKEVKAASPMAAAEGANVPAGATVHVIPKKNVTTYKRPDVAPLEKAA